MHAQHGSRLGLAALSSLSSASLFARALRGALQYLVVRHARTAAAAQGQQTADQRADHEHDDDDGFEHCDTSLSVTRIKPSCEALATSRPSRANTLPRVKPRAPEALGLSMAYSSQSSTRTLR